MLGKKNSNVQDTTDHSWSDDQAPRPKKEMPSHKQPNTQQQALKTKHSSLGHGTPTFL